MEHRAAAVSPLYLLERFEPGIVHLDKQRHVIGMNDFARRVLPVDEKQPFDQMVLDFHPGRSRPKVEFLLDQAAQCPVAAPPPMTMIINIPERVLLIKVSRMSDATSQPTGYVLVLYAITDVVASKDETQPSRSDARRRLLKIPTVSQNRIVFVDADDILCIRSDGHYTRVITAKGKQFCNLAIGNIETRLDPEHFMRVHRSHVINLRAVRQLQRDEGRVAVQLHGVVEPVAVSRSSAAAQRRCSTGWACRPARRWPAEPNECRDWTTDTRPADRHFGTATCYSICASDLTVFATHRRRPAA